MFDCGQYACNSKRSNFALEASFLLGKLVLFASTCTFFNFIDLIYMHYCYTADPDITGRNLIYSPQSIEYRQIVNILV